MLIMLKFFLDKFKESSLNINDIPRTSSGLVSVIGTSEAAADQVCHQI